MELRTDSRPIGVGGAAAQLAQQFLLAIQVNFTKLFKTKHSLSDIQRQVGSFGSRGPQAEREAGGRVSEEAVRQNDSPHPIRDVGRAKDDLRRNRRQEQPEAKANRQ